MPGSFQPGMGIGVPNVPRSMPIVRSYANGEQPFFAYGYTIGGVTKNSSGAALPSCAVTLHRTADDSVAGRAVSDGAGAYRIDASPSLTHYAKAYKAGAPDVAGTTVNTLVGT